MKKIFILMILVLFSASLFSGQSAEALSGVQMGLKARPTTDFVQQLPSGQNGENILGWVNPATIEVSFFVSSKVGANKGEQIPSWNIAKVFRNDDGSQILGNFGGIKNLRLEIWENNDAYVWNAPLDNFTGVMATGTQKPNHPVYNKFGYHVAPSLLVDRAPVSWKLLWGGDMNFQISNFGWPQLQLVYNSAKLYRLRLVASASTGGQTFTGTVDSLVYPKNSITMLADMFGPRLRWDDNDMALTDYPTFYKYSQIVGKDARTLLDVMQPNALPKEKDAALEQQTRVQALNNARAQGAVFWHFGHPAISGYPRNGLALAKSVVSRPTYDSASNSWSDFWLQVPVAPWQDYETTLTEYRLRLFEKKNCNITADFSTRFLPHPLQKEVSLTYQTALVPENQWVEVAGVKTLVDKKVKVTEVAPNNYGPMLKLSATDLAKLSADFYSADSAKRSCAFIGVTALDLAGNQSWDGVAIFLNQQAALSSAQTSINNSNPTNQSVAAMPSGQPLGNNGVSTPQGVIGGNTNISSTATVVPPVNSNNTLNSVRTWQKVGNTFQQIILPRANNTNSVLPQANNASAPAFTPTTPASQNILNNPAVVPSVSSSPVNSSATGNITNTLPITVPAYNTGWWKPFVQWLQARTNATTVTAPLILPLPTGVSPKFNGPVYSGIQDLPFATMVGGL